MLPVMTKKQIHNPPEKDTGTDDQGWGQLYDRIRQLSLRRSALMLAETIDEDDAFDRGARALRTLMGAAEISRRMKLQDAKEQSLDDEQETGPIVSDARIQEICQSVEQSIDRAEKGHQETTSTRSDSAPVLPGAGGKIVEDQRS